MISAILLLVTVLTIALSLAVVVRNYYVKSSWYFSLFSVSVAAWAFGIERFLNVSSPNELQFWSKWYYFAAAAIALMFVLFTTSISGYNYRVVKVLALVSSLVLGLQIIFNKNFPIFPPELVGSQRAAEINPLSYIVYSFYFVGFFFGGLWLLRQMLRRGGNFETKQLQILFTGVAISGVFGAFFNLLLPFLGNYRLIWAGPVSLSLFLLITGYGIIKHRLFNIRLVIARSVAYLLLLSSLLVLYSSAIVIFSRLVVEGDSNPTIEFLVNAGVVIVAAATAQPLKRFFDHATNRLFYRDAYNSESVIRQVNDVVLSSLALEGLLFGVVQTLVDELSVQFGAAEVKQVKNVSQTIIATNGIKFEQSDIEQVRRATNQFDKRVVLTDELQDSELQSTLRKYEIDMLARIVADPTDGDEGLGYVMLGPKRSGSLYTSKDVELLNLIAGEMVVAVQNALRFEEISQFNEQLTQRVDAATTELKDKNRKLRELDEAKDDFISMASHQLRTPLTTVKGYLSMLDDGDIGKLSKKQQEVVELAFASSERMVYLISDLLNASRIDTGKFVIERQPIKLGEVIKSEVEQLVITAKARGLKLVSEFSDDDPTVKLDETKLRQVIMNFIDNAIYYSKSGGEITVKYEVTADTVEMCVVDEGIGVPAAEQDDLFTKFYRAKNAKRVRPDGTGLGLFLAKKVITAQGGSVIFESVEDKGSTFGFRFALAAVATNQEPESKK